MKNGARKVQRSAVRQVSKVRRAALREVGKTKKIIAANAKQIQRAATVSLGQAKRGWVSKYSITNGHRHPARHAIKHS